MSLLHQAESDAELSQSDYETKDHSISGQAQGDVIYRDGSAWTRLAAGTKGQPLRTGGSAANPSWADYGVSLQKTGDTTAAAAAVSFTTEEDDDGGLHDNSTNPTRITIPAGMAGWYLITAWGSMTTSSSVTKTITIRQDGTTTLTSVDAPASTAVNLSCSTIKKLAAAAYVELVATNNGADPSSTYRLCLVRI